MKPTETIKQIKEKLADVYHPDDPLLAQYEEDSRKGVQTAVAQTRKRIDRQLQIKDDHDKRLSFENDLRRSGFQAIAGVDEVGRGPLAGPVVAAAVILPKNCDDLIGVTDSKQVSLKDRTDYAQRIKQVALAYSIWEVDAATIDRLNIYEATKIAMQEAVSQLEVQPDYVLVDAMTLDIDTPQMSIIKGDQRSLSIAAASILAKVYRDEKMAEYGKQFPEYQWDKNAGYGTAAHLAALDQLGYTRYHRRSFKPINEMTKFNNRKK